MLTALRGAAVALLAVIAVALSACVVRWGYTAECGAAGLTAAELEQALPDSDGWQTRVAEGASYRERFTPLAGADRLELVEFAVLDGDRGRLRVEVYAGYSPSAAQRTDWHRRMEAIVAAIEAVHPAVGQWEYTDFTGDPRPDLCLWGCGVAAVVAASTWLLLRRRRAARARGAVA